MDALNLLLWKFVGARRDNHTAQWCKRKFVGLVRVTIGPEAPQGIIPLRSEAARTHAAKMLRKWCEHCGQCEMGQTQEVMLRVPR